MQDRQKDRARYFRELALTSEKYFIPYIAQFLKPVAGMNVLEIGCGDGGNLLPFARLGCNVTGVDLAEGKIENARKFFAEAGAEGRFIASDIFKIKELEASFDIVLCHDVLEHISDKARFMADLQKYVRPGGVVFMAFPAWQMPFGGHQQICRSKVLSHLPFFHLLPRSVYRGILRLGGEAPFRIAELLEIKDTRLPIEHFEALLKTPGAAGPSGSEASSDAEGSSGAEAAAGRFDVLDRTLWLINPHYEIKFGLRPRRLAKFLSAIPHLRNFFTTSAFYILRRAL